MATLPGQLARSIQIVGLALPMAVGCSSEAPPTTVDLPPPCELLPIISTSPLVLNDSHETRDYLNAFPVSAYRKYGVPDAGHFFIDDVEDDIKRVIVAGIQWEAGNVEMLEKHVEPGSVVVEVGAHVGSHTLPIARMVGRCGRVYAFEPQRKLYRELHRNLALNGITNVVPLRYAIGAGEARIIEMDLPTPGNEGGTGIGTGGDEAELRNLDSFRFERVSVLKIDVEGYEDEVLDGAVDTIRRNRPVVLIEIMGGQHLRDGIARSPGTDTRHMEAARSAWLHGGASRCARLHRTVERLRRRFARQLTRRKPVRESARRYNRAGAGEFHAGRSQSESAGWASPGRVPGTVPMR
ncbi:MAG: FkbM family methyltransferase [Gammaproteobacteria bacterium]|nr:FkbM family methyltransferase [Gammaproteobacteria bacterium]